MWRVALQEHIIIYLTKSIATVVMHNCFSNCASFAFARGV